MAKYEGWENWKTWNISLWIDNERGEYEYWHEQADEMSVSELTSALEETFWGEVESFEGKMHPALYSSLSLSINSVDWKEIAEHLKAE